MLDEKWQDKFNQTYVEFLQLSLLSKIRKWMNTSEREFSSATNIHRILNELKTGGQQHLTYEQARKIADFHGIPPWLIIAGAEQKNTEILKLFREEPSEIPQAFDYAADSLLDDLTRLTRRLSFTHDEESRISQAIDLIRSRLITETGGATSAVKLLRNSVLEDNASFARVFVVGRAAQSSSEPVSVTIRYASNSYEHNRKPHKLVTAWMVVEGEVTDWAETEIKRVVSDLTKILKPTDHWEVVAPLQNHKEVRVYSWFRSSRNKSHYESKRDIEDSVRYLLQGDPVLTMHFQPTLRYKQTEIDPNLIDLISWNVVSQLTRESDLKCGQSTAEVLIQSGYLRAGDRLAMKFGRGMKYFNDVDRRFFGTFELNPVPAIRWEIDNKVYPFTSLTMKLLRDLGRIADDSKSRVDGYTCWGLDKQNTSLFEAAKIIASADSVYLLT